MSVMQDQRMRQALARLELLSHGSTQSFNGAGGKESEHPGGKQPVGDSKPVHDTLRGRYEAAGDELGRELVIQDAEAELRLVTHRRRTTVKGETIGELHARIRKLATEGWSDDEISVHCRCTKTAVREAKAKVVDAEIERLVEQGKSERYIATLLRVPKSTVHERKRKAA